MDYRHLSSPARWPWSTPLRQCRPSPLIVSLAPRAMMTSGPHNATRGTGRPAPDAPAAAVRLLRCRSIDSGLP